MISAALHFVPLNILQHRYERLDRINTGDWSLDSLETILAMLIFGPPIFETYWEIVLIGSLLGIQIKYALWVVLLLPALVIGCCIGFISLIAHLMVAWNRLDRAQ